ncbi:hypothetical protein JOD97_003283 [Duganella sp. 1411]|uniref:hypothetical protein n=1 Tax=Duganella sp. 1411 TaxID=2806572 RepID=UPI001AE46B90|nr:hypothetical protein [Duganella sp. 1411]MBP1205241.1 hypothetical protein [Duganella sp. 1411]
MSEENKDGVEASIKKWLKETGFPLEMQAAHVFNELGYDVRQSYVVKDIQEDKPREIDILAKYPFELDLGITKIFCILECKSSKHPWLVFDGENTLSSYNMLHSFAIMSPDAFSAISGILFSDKSRKSWELFQRSPKCGYALRQPFSDKDTGYTAAMNVLKACRNMVEPPQKTSLPNINVAFPILVVDKPIFECAYVEGELVVKEVPHSKFLFSSYIPDLAVSRINIVHIDHLDSFAKHYINVATKLREMLAETEQNAMEKAKGRS